MPNPVNRVMTLKRLDDRDRATALLSAAVAQEESAETWYLAAMVATDRRERLQLLQKALAVDPFHPQAVSAWENLVRSPQYNPSLDDVLPQRPERLAQAVALFRENGWDLKVEMTQMAQLEKRRGMDLLSGGMLVGLLSIIGTLIVILRLAIAGVERVNLQAQPDGSVRVLTDRRSLTVHEIGELMPLATSVRGGMTPLYAVGIGLGTLVFWLLVI